MTSCVIECILREQLGDISCVVSVPQIRVMKQSVTACGISHSPAIRSLIFKFFDNGFFTIDKIFLRKAKALRWNAHILAIVKKYLH